MVVAVKTRKKKMEYELGKKVNSEATTILTSLLYCHSSLYFFFFSAFVS